VRSCPSGHDARAATATVLPAGTSSGSGSLTVR
jgi:hypothetical protein